MSLHVPCLLLTCLIVCQGLEVTIHRTIRSQFCAQLLCEQTVSQTDQRISFLIGLSIYNLTSENSKAKLASLSLFEPDLQINPSKVEVINGTGSITKNQAHLALSFQHVTDCLHGSFLCELDFTNVSGQPDTITRSIHPEDNSFYTFLEDQLSSLTSRFNNMTSNTQTSLVALAQENTAMKGKVTQLTLKDTLLEGNVSQLAQENTALKGKVTQLTQENSAQEGKILQLKQNDTVLEGRIIQLTQKNTALEGKVSAITNETTVLKSSLDHVVQRLSMLEAQANSTITIAQMACYKGMPRRQTRLKFLLWGQIPALCDTETDGGGWVLIQRRMKGDVDFNRNWTEYRNGFGTPDTDFWIGLEIIRILISQGFSELRVDLKNAGSPVFAQYSNFSITNESMNYQLLVFSGFSGTAGEGFHNHYRMNFSTTDRDNAHNSVNCAATCGGGWWYTDRGCLFSNLNGLWATKQGMVWTTIWESYIPGTTELKLRRQ